MLRFRAIVAAALLLAACATSPGRLTHIRVIARDYTFAFPDTVWAGPTAFRLVNEGKARHEMQLYRFKPGISRDSAFKMVARDSIPDEAVDVDGGVLITGPADSTWQELLTTLHSGDVYALECAFRNAKDLPRHRDLGMIAVFQVH